MTSLNPDSFGKVKILVVGNTGAGKTTLCSRLVTGDNQNLGGSTAGCSVQVRLCDYSETSGSQQRYFVELWDVGAHRRYKALRKVFYQQVNGVIVVHDVTSPGKSLAMQRWATEISRHGTFTAPLPPEVADVNLGGLPVPVLVIYNKVDKLQQASFSPVDLVLRIQGAILQVWPGQREHGGLLPSDNDDTICGLRISAIKEKMDTSAIEAFFHSIIERRYYGGGAEVPGISGRPYVAASATGRPGGSSPSNVSQFSSVSRAHSLSDAADHSDIEGRLDASEDGSLWSPEATRNHPSRHTPSGAPGDFQNGQGVHRTSSMGRERGGFSLKTLSDTLNLSKFL